MKEITTHTIQQKLEIWLKATNANDTQLDFAAVRFFDPKTVVAEWSKEHLIWIAKDLGLIKVCGQLSIDLVKVIAHLAADPRVEVLIEAAQRCLDNPTDENRAAAFRLRRVLKNSVAAEAAEAAAAEKAWARVNRVKKMKAWQKVEEAARHEIEKAAEEAIWASKMAARGVQEAGINSEQYLSYAAVWIDFAKDSAYKAAVYHPELIHQLDELMHTFRANVYNSLIVELEK